MAAITITVEYCTGGVLADRWLVTMTTGAGDDARESHLGHPRRYVDARGMANACKIALRHANPDAVVTITAVRPPAPAAI